MAPNPCNPIALTLADLQASLQSLRSGLVAELTSVLETQLNSAIEAAVTPAVEAALAPLSSMLDGIRSTAEEQGRRMDAFEHDMCDYSDRIVALEETVARLSSENQQLKDKNDDLESRSRRCNLRIVGIPEKMERGDPVGFMTGFFTEVLGTTLVPAPLKLDRAHRIGAPPTPDGVNPKPRVFIVRFHNFQDKERVLRRQSRDQLIFRGIKVFIFPDLTSSIAKKRALFLGIKRRLSEKK
ncbi:hypothetical protein DPEC_G00246720 [Dallia pectoralis]|uniref:Uncharacterized protein n=1 Tax=Dallia pectoralis TaxID=75939 RepID=A0ACC2FW51_DALPE|nr:hypothetical protein DPEC_G00246720 [Dallia pectoralis]